MDIPVLYEDENCLVINKPVGVLVHRAKHQKRFADGSSTVADWLVERHPLAGRVGDDPGERPGIVHRLDKGTSGVLLLAKTQAAFEFFKRQFQNGKVEKAYVALAHGKFREAKGTIDKPIGILDGSTKRSVHAKKMLKAAFTDYEVVGEKETSRGWVSLVAVRPRTGRTHQIRVHLACIGHPILGDKLYGKKDDAPRLMLHARSLVFDASPGKRIRIEAPEPAEFGI